jgi:hypothetical protein
VAWEGKGLVVYKVHGGRGDLVVSKGIGELAKTFSNMLNYFYNIF